MKVEINIKDKFLKDGVRFGIEWSLIENFNCEVLDAVGVPSLNVLSDELLNDQVFMKKYLKNIVMNLESGDFELLEAISEAADEHVIQKALKPWIVKCEKEQEKFDKEEEALRMAKDDQQTIAHLERRGYTVTKK